MRRVPPCLALVWAALLLASGPVSAEGAAPLSVAADRLEFDAGARRIAAAGHVILTYGDINLSAAAVEYDRGLVLATGGVELTAAEGHLVADWLALDLMTRTYTAEGLHGRLGEFFIRGARLEPAATGGHRLEEAEVSRCDLAVPCYQLRAGRITLHGRKITIEKGWLALKGRRILPLPRLTLDLDRMDRWPQLRAELGAHGLLLGARLPFPLAADTELVLDGEAATDGHYALRPSLLWRPAPDLAVEPWVEQAAETGARGGLDLDLRAGAAHLSLSLAYNPPERAFEADAAVDGPSRPFMGGSLVPGAYWSYADAPSGETSRAGGVLRWSFGQPGRTAVLSLTAGGRTAAGIVTPEVLVGAAADYRLNEAWGLDADLAYDAAADAWRVTDLGLIRHLHCFYLRLGHDPRAGGWSLTGGIVF